VNVHEYAAFCGPQALAAVLEIQPLEAARRLLEIRDRERWPGQTSGETRQDVMVRALLEAGADVEEWSVEIGEWRRGSAVDYVLDAEMGVAVEVRRAERAVLEAALPDPPLPSDAELARSALRCRRAGLRRLDRYLVYQWLERRRVGVWILTVPGHYVAARAGELVSGVAGLSSDAAPLERAWRVVC
jgi:hypothetical protein